MSKWFRSYGLADVAPGLLIGAYPLDEEDVETLERHGVRRVLNLVEDGEYGPGVREAVTRAFDDAGIHEERLSLTDFGGLPPEQLGQAVAVVNRWLDRGLATYVHCRAGWQRSAAVAAAVLALREDMDVELALQQIQHCKPSANPLPHQREDLRRWWAICNGSP